MRRRRRALTAGLGFTRPWADILKRVWPGMAKHEQSHRDDGEKLNLNPDRECRKPSAADYKRLFGIDLPPQAVDTISHAAMALSRTDLDASLAEHRVMEILLLIGHLPAIMRMHAGATFSERARHHIALAPMDSWRAHDLARLLGVSSATLRRASSRLASCVR